MAQRISKIVLTDGGVWDSSKTYPPYTYVRHNGDGWWSTRSTTASEPAKGNADWVQATDTQEFIVKLKEATSEAQAITDSATQAEQLRVEAEQARVDAENERNADENLRKLAEAERLAEESKRQSAEKNRAAAEAVRDGRYNEAEENRNTVFLAAESERQTAEEARKQAEAARIQAENERDAAEQLREAATVETKAAAADAKSATEAANTAAGKANEAAGKANEVADKVTELNLKVVDAILGSVATKESFHADYGTHTSGVYLHMFKGETYKVTASIDSAPTTTIYLQFRTGEDAGTILASLNITAGQTKSNESTIVASEDMDVYVYSYHTHPVDVYFTITRINKIDNLQERLTNVETEVGVIPSLQEDIKYINAHFNGNYEIDETIVASEVKTIGLKVFAGRTYNVKANIQNPLDVDVYIEVRDVKNIQLFSIPIFAGDTQSQPGDGAVSFTNDQELTLSLYSSKNVSNLHFTLYEVVSLDKASNDAYSISKKLYGVDGNPQVRVTESVFDSVADFADVMNQEFSDYATRSHGSPACMMKLKSTDTWDVIVEKSNHNFRNNVIDLKLPKDINVISINAALEKPIMRFCDARLYNLNNTYSVETGMQGDEPSVIASEDGNKLYLYAHLKRRDSKDGVNWGNEQQLTLTGASYNYVMHVNVNLIDGVYYLIGCPLNEGGDLVLYTSEDGLNFTYRGIIFKASHVVAQNVDVVDGAGVVHNTTLNVDNWGNTYLIKDPGGLWYLYYEFQDTNVPQVGWTGWQMAGAYCTDIFRTNTDGTIGNWADMSTNPIIPYLKNVNQTAGNMDFAKLEDNRPVKFNGYYYAYYHGESNDTRDPQDPTKNRAQLYRAKSVDLTNWISEGQIFDNRDDGTMGAYTPTNADHCIIGWKGRTYLFYTWNINDPNNLPYIKVTIDDRPIHELLGIRP